MNIQLNKKSFYYKYLKYKLKYFKLKQFGFGKEDSNPNKRFKYTEGQTRLTDTVNSNNTKINITNNDLFILFISSKIFERQQSQTDRYYIAEASKSQTEKASKSQIEEANINRPQRDHNKPKRYRDYESELTPLIKRYIESRHYDTDDIDNLRLLIDKSLDSDTDKIMKAFAKLDLTDTEYKNYENYGKLVECWISDNMKCPCCEQYSLRRYASDIMPVIDLVCINPEHKFSHGVKFYQVKASNGTLFMGSKYFNKDTKIIHVGSVNYGYLVHSVKISDDDFKKKILIGYICIEFAEKDDTLQIKSNNSFIVYPKYDNTVKQLFGTIETNTTVNIDQEFGESYYKYIDSVHSIQLAKQVETNQLLKQADQLPKQVDQLAKQVETNKTKQIHPIIKFSNINNQIKKIDDYILTKTIPKSYLDTNRWSQKDNPLKDIIQ